MKTNFQRSTLNAQRSTFNLRRAFEVESWTFKVGRSLTFALIFFVVVLDSWGQATNYTITISLNARQQAGLAWVMEQEGSTNTAQVFLRQRLLSVLRSYAAQERENTLADIRAKFERLSATNQTVIKAQIEAVLPPPETNTPPPEP